MSIRWYQNVVLRIAVTACVAALAVRASSSSAQEVAVPAAQVPAVKLAAKSASESLTRTIALRLNDVPLADALKVVGQRAGLAIAYSGEALPTDKRVSLVADKISVRDALSVLLEDTGLEAVAAAPGFIALRPIGRMESILASENHQQGTATISGYVRDSATEASIPQVSIRIDGTTLETQSGSDGHYKITGVAAGEYRVTARRVGYVAHTRTLTVTDGQVATLNFLMNPPATRLDEVVTTAAGEQRRYQIGNDISTINVDSIAPTVPAASVTDIISGRAPGVEVIETGGLVGSGQAIRIWGQSSLALQSDPIIIIDGIRTDNGTNGGSYSSTFNGSFPSPNRLNDLDFSQIATIDILKGPAATTEYGTAAANGVIVITTKRGTSGAPQWHVSAEQAASVIPVGFQNYYTAWGHATNGRGTAEFCPLTGGVFYAGVSDNGLRGQCVVDSIRAFNPLNVPAYSSFGTGPSSVYNLDVGGGSDALRYYVAGDLGTSVGGTHLPQVFAAEASALGFPASELKPNTEDQQSLRANTTIRLGTKADMQINVAYLSTDQDSPTSQQLIPFPIPGSAPPDSTNEYGYGSDGGFIGGLDNPLFHLGDDQSQLTQRFTGGLSANWRPTAWLTTRATVGLDHGSQQTQSLSLPQSEYVYGAGLNSGSISEGTGTNDTYTAELTGTATNALTPMIRANTSLGLDLDDNHSAGLQSSVYGLSAANFTFNGAASYSAPTSLMNYAITVGGFAQEMLSLSDRVFLTGSIRVDAGSGFGGNYNATTYPGLQASWIVIQTPTTSVRLRGALGSSGNQPPYGAALQQYTLVSTQGPGIASNPITGYALSNDGNLRLTPERSAEYEGGVDLSFFASRLDITAGGYSKTTYNALYDQPLGFDLDNLNYEENLGEIRNTGFDATVTGVVVQTPVLHWTLTFNASVNTNKLVTLAPGVLTTVAGNSYLNGVAQYFTPGYPLYGYWGDRVAYVDQNNDGIIERNEVTADTALSYVGSSLPRQELSLQTYVGLWREMLTIGALFDYRGNFFIYNNQAQTITQETGADVADNQPNAPTWMQARDQAEGIGGLAGVPSDFFENGSYLRFRELSLTYNLPRRLAHAVRLTGLGLTGAVRNLALWTRFSGGDPEVSTPSGGGASSAPGTGAYEANNDLRSFGFGAIPLTRSWTVRLNVEF